MRPPILKLLYLKILNIIINFSFIPSPLRARIQSLRGVKFKDINSVWIGDNVTFDMLRPEKIYVGENVTFSKNSVVLTHFYDTSRYECEFNYEDVFIGDNVFIGVGAIIAASVKISDGAVIGAGSVVVHDIEPNAIVSGSPAKIVGYRKLKKSS